MRWYSKVYYSEHLPVSPQELRSQVESGRTDAPCYVLTTAYHDRDQLDLRPLRELGRDYIRRKDCMIVGFAKDRDDGMELIVRIVQDCWQKRGNALIRQFLLGQEAL